MKNLFEKPIVGSTENGLFLQLSWEMSIIEGGVVTADARNAQGELVERWIVQVVTVPQAVLLMGLWKQGKKVLGV